MCVKAMCLQYNTCTGDRESDKSRQYRRLASPVSACERCSCQSHAHTRTLWTDIHPDHCSRCLLPPPSSLSPPTPPLSLFRSSYRHCNGCDLASECPRTRVQGSGIALSIGSAAVTLAVDAEAASLWQQARGVRRPDGIHCMQSLVSFRHFFSSFPSFLPPLLFLLPSSPTRLRLIASFFSLDVMFTSLHSLADRTGKAIHLHEQRE